MKCLGLIVLVAAIWVIQTFVVMLLWNTIIVGLFAAPQADFWYAAGVSLVLALLASVFRGRSAQA